MTTPGPKAGPVGLTRLDRVALVVLNEPSRRNAMSEGMTAEWVRTMAALRADPDVRCVVVTGAGSAFCAGGDRRTMFGGAADAMADDQKRVLTFYRSWLEIRNLAVPTIAAVNGPAIGAGACLALACDIRYGGPSAQFAFPFTALGITPGMGATHLLPEAVGHPRSRELLYTSRTVEASESVSVGLLSGMHAEPMLDRVLETAARIAAAPGAAMAMLRQRLGSESDVAEALDWEARAQALTMFQLRQTQQGGAIT